MKTRTLNLSNWVEYQVATGYLIRRDRCGVGTDDPLAGFVPYTMPSMSGVSYYEAPITQPKIARRQVGLGLLWQGLRLLVGI